jgi:ABC-2 type transport system permease protein
MSLGPYRAVVAARFRVHLQYRGAALAGVFTQCFFGLVRVMVFEAFYRSAPAGAAPPMSHAQMCSYVWLGQAMLAMFPWSTDADLRELVRTGNVGYELCRPVDLYGLWWSRALAWRTAPVLLRMVPMFVISMAVLPLVGLGSWRLLPPPTLAAAGAWLLCTVGALLLCCAITTLMSISLLWTISGQGVSILLGALTMVCCGLVIPLPLLPRWAQATAELLPFAGIMDLPGRVFTGHIPLPGVPRVLALQLGWAVALIALGRFWLGRGTRRLVMQGG